MSLIFFIGFILSVMGKIETLPENFGIVWALFSIADALWIGRCSK